MDRRNTLLAQSLTVLAGLQKKGKRVIRGSELPRMDRQRLVKAGFLEEVFRGWYLPSRPAAADAGGLRLVTLAQALVAVGPAFFTQQPMAARIALASVQDSSDLLRPLLDGGHVHIAGRLAGAMRAIGRADVAGEMVAAMGAAGMEVKESRPFDVAAAFLPAGRTESPYVRRLRLMWQQMRQRVIDEFPPPNAAPQGVDAVLRNVQERYVTDAYHSLSIEGYRVTLDLIEKVRNGRWHPDGEDAKTRDAMAAKGYYDAHLEVKDYIAQALTHQPDRWHLHDALTGWYRALFSPSVIAGILRPSDLAGWRNDQVFIQGALHVPMSKAAVRECMPVFFELLADEPHAAVRAVLGHFFFVYIHPYMDGNGRLARFIFNAMLVTGGYVWTIVPLDQRSAYLAALGQASSLGDIQPLARFFADLLREQSTRPLPRPKATSSA